MTAVTHKPAAAALNVYIKVAIIRKADDVLTYEDSEGTIKTVTDLHLAAAVTVSPPYVRVRGVGILLRSILTMTTMDDFFLFPS